MDTLHTQKQTKSHGIHSCGKHYHQTQLQTLSGSQMTTLNDILNNIKQTQLSTDTGTKIHTILQHITIDNNGTKSGNVEYIKKIEQVPNLQKFFSPDSKTELPIAGTINNKFISRRIDRILINHETKTISQN